MYPLNIYSRLIERPTQERDLRSTTVVAIRRNNRIVMAADGQVTLGSTVVKSKARKVRKIYKDRVLVGFAGASADALTLMMRLEGKLEEYGGNLARAVVELAKDWRMDRMLRRLEALMLVGDRDHLFLVSGNGDVLEPDDNLAAIGSGGPFALSALRALVRHTNMDIRDMAVEALRIASEICIYTNSEIIVEEL